MNMHNWIHVNILDRVRAMRIAGLNNKLKKIALNIQHLDNFRHSNLLFKINAAK